MHVHGGSCFFLMLKFSIFPCTWWFMHVHGGSYVFHVHVFLHGRASNHVHVFFHVHDGSCFPGSWFMFSIIMVVLVFHGHGFMFSIVMVVYVFMLMVVNVMHGGSWFSWSWFHVVHGHGGSCFPCSWWFMVFMVMVFFCKSCGLLVIATYLK